jgi:23S rRNA pseudouridine2605 synthase
MKLNKYISVHKTSSKKIAEDYISKKKVKVNDLVITDIFFPITKNDKVYLNNKLIKKKNSGYILYNKPAVIDSNSIPLHLKKFLKRFYNDEDYNWIGLDIGVCGLVLFYDDDKLNQLVNNIWLLFDLKFKNQLNKNQKNDLNDFITSMDEFSEINFIDNKNVAVKIRKKNQSKLFFKLNEFNVLIIDRVLIQNLDKFDIPRGKFRKLNDLEILNLKSLSTSPYKSSSH